jgi:hypothetical protein
MVIEFVAMERFGPGIGCVEDVLSDRHACDVDLWKVIGLL